NCNSGPRATGGSITVAVGKAPKTWNIATGGPDTIEQEMPLLPGAFTFLPSGKVAWNEDLLQREPQVVGQTPVQVVYQLRPEAVWNDGTGHTHPVSAQDFVYTWRLFTQRIDGYDRIASVVADGGKVTVTFGEPYGDWRGLFANLEPFWFAAATTGADPTDA